MAPPNKGPRGPMGPGMKPGEKPKFEKKTFSRLLKYFAPYKFRLLLVLLCIITTAIVGVATSLFLQVLIDDYITPLLAASVPDFSGLFAAILFVGCVFLIGIIAGFAQQRLMIAVSQGILKRVRDELFAHMQHLPIRYFDTNTHGDLMSRFTNDTDTMRQLITGSIPQVVSSTISIITVFIAMITTDFWLTVLTVVTVILMMMCTKKLMAKSSKFFIDQQKSLGAVNGFVEEMMHGQKVVKVFCHEEEAMKDFTAKNDELCKNATEATRFSNILGPVMNNLGHLQYALIAIVGGALAIWGVGGLTLGGIAAFLMLSRSFTQPVNQIAQQVGSLFMAMAGAQRIFDVMDQKPEADEGYVSLVNAHIAEDGTITECEEHTGEWAWKHPHGDGTTTYTKLTGKVDFYDVDFAYEENKLVLRNVTIHAAPGEKIALVGATGAGKTTITNLINRFYDIADGKIRYDDININKIKKADLRRSLAVVLQDVNLFTGTVMENIRYGKLDATDEECIAAAKLANADSFIRMLPEGYNTVLEGDGSGLSQGQRQLLSIARAAVADPPVMILDEATSSIDTRTEAIVQRGMDALMKGRTVFVIAHRLSTVQNSDHILVLEHGRVIEQGDHYELIEQKGKYYQLYTGAFELE